MNLATARATKRSLEVGVRKVVGAGRTQLIYQFISEAVIVTSVAFFVGLLIAEFFLPHFNNFVEKDLSLSITKQASFLLILFSISLLVGFLSGSYPALFLSKFRPANVLKGQAHQALSGERLRKTLVVLQFSVSTILIISTIIALNQLQFVLEKDLGFRDDQVMYIPVFSIPDQVETFKQKILNHYSVIQASAASEVPGQFGYQMRTSYDPNKPEKQFSAYIVRSDENYDDVLKLKLAAGRFFDKNRPTDRDTARLINEAMLEKLGWGTPQEAIGKRLTESYTVIGVVKDFHFKSLHFKIKPVVMKMKPNSATRGYNYVLIRFNTDRLNELISFLQKEWMKFSGNPLEYHFLDETFAQQYETDRKLSNAFTVFAGLAILIACMGLLGLTAFSAERRTKEIGIRKVVGATVTNIVTLLSKDFLKLVLLGFVIAVPIAWYVMNQWLSDFAYRIEIGPGIFLLAGGIAILIALVTVGWQSFRAATTNPVESLRSE